MDDGEGGWDFFVVAVAVTVAVAVAFVGFGFGFVAGGLPRGFLIFVVVAAFFSPLSLLSLLLLIRGFLLFAAAFSPLALFARGALFFLLDD